MGRALQVGEIGCGNNAATGTNSQCSCASGSWPQPLTPPLARREAQSQLHTLLIHPSKQAHPREDSTNSTPSHSSAIDCRRPTAGRPCWAPEQASPAAPAGASPSLPAAAPPAPLWGRCRGPASILALLLPLPAPRSGISGEGGSSTSADVSLRWLCTYLGQRIGRQL